jgi:hypothetical protein
MQQPQQPNDAQLVQHKTDMHLNVPQEIMALEKKN